MDRRRLIALTAVAISAVVLVSCPAQQTEQPTGSVSSQPAVQQIPSDPQPSISQRAVDSAPARWVGDAMDFSFTTFAGENVRASSFAGKPLVVNFWASW